MENTTPDITHNTNVLASDILALTRDKVLINVRFANRAGAALPLKINNTEPGCSTDGRAAVFSTEFVLDAFAGNNNMLTHSYLHMMMHCLLGHITPPVNFDPLTWSVAADLTVESAILTLDCKACSAARPHAQSIVEKWLQQTQNATAHEFYQALLSQKITKDELAQIELAVGIDSHKYWWSTPDSLPATNNMTQDAAAQSKAQLQKKWEQIAKTTEQELSKQAGQTSPVAKIIRPSLHAPTLKLKDYLTQILSTSETMQPSTTDFDAIIYTYGLATFGNVALIEPVEFSEAPKPFEIVLAIDTSASVQGRAVRAFVDECFSVLFDYMHENGNICVRLIQCDNQIRQETLIKSASDLESACVNFEIQGFGSTDFRPVFEHVDELLESGEIKHCAGLLYFTDGRGQFPHTRPSYDVAYVFYGSGAMAPMWASRVVIEPDLSLTEK